MASPYQFEPEIPSEEKETADESASEEIESEEEVRNDQKDLK